MFSCDLTQVLPEVHFILLLVPIISGCHLDTLIVLNKLAFSANFGAKIDT